jgi:hypothetical protein
MEWTVGNHRVKVTGLNVRNSAAGSFVPLVRGWTNKFDAPYDPTNGNLKWLVFNDAYTVQITSDTNTIEHTIDMSKMVDQGTGQRLDTLQNTQNGNGGNPYTGVYTLTGLQFNDYSGSASPTTGIPAPTTTGVTTTGVPTTTGVVTTTGVATTTGVPMTTAVAQACTTNPASGSCCQQPNSVAANGTAWWCNGCSCVDVQDAETAPAGVDCSGCSTGGTCNAGTGNCCVRNYPSGYPQAGEGWWCNSCNCGDVSDRATPPAGIKCCDTTVTPITATGSTVSAGVANGPVATTAFFFRFFCMAAVIRMGHSA